MAVRDAQVTKFLAETGFGIGYALMLLGVLLLLDGFALDAWLHAEDPELASREDLFTLGNPGHALVFVGLAVTIVGACVGPYTRWVLPSRSTLAAAFVPAIALGIALGGSLGFSAAIDSWSHDDGAAHGHDSMVSTGGDMAASTGGLSHGHSGGADEFQATNIDGDPLHPQEAFVLDENLGTVAIAESTMGHAVNDQPVAAENLRFAETFLADVRTGTEKYKDVSVALADGYTRITPDIPLIGAHYFHAGYDGMDPARPSILLYHDNPDGTHLLAGVSFTLPKTLGDNSPPETELGGLAGWHYHSRLCFLSGGNVTIAADAEHCAGVFTAETGWLLHVWAWLDSPEGVFDHANSLLQ